MMGTMIHVIRSKERMPMPPLASPVMRRCRTRLDRHTQVAGIAIRTPSNSFVPMQYEPLIFSPTPVLTNVAPYRYPRLGTS